MNDRFPHRAAQKLRAYRNGTSPKLRQEDLARRLGVSRLSIVKWEAGAMAPDEMKRRLHMMGVCEPNDWFVPAVCSECGLAFDHPAVAACARALCPAQPRVDGRSRGKQPVAA